MIRIPLALDARGGFRPGSADRLLSMGRQPEPPEDPM